MLFVLDYKTERALSCQKSYMSNVCFVIPTVLFVTFPVSHKFNFKYFDHSNLLILESVVLLEEFSFTQMNLVDFWLVFLNRTSCGLFRTKQIHTLTDFEILPSRLQRPRYGPGNIIHISVLKKCVKTSEVMCRFS